MTCLANRTDRVHRISAALLLVFLLLPFLALDASFGLVDEAALPACCRVHGEHHCSMGRSAVESSGSQEVPTASTVSEKCPFQGFVPATHIPTDYGSPSVFSRGGAFLQSSHIGARQNLCSACETFHDHPKRGPPNPARSPNKLTHGTLCFVAA